MEPPHHPPEQPRPANTTPGEPGDSLPTRRPERFLSPLVCLFLAAMVWFVFGQTLHHGFVNYDDGRYVYENRVVQKGLTWEGCRWAFTHVAVGNWHPLTMLSHTLDCQLYGLNPAGHHLTNVLLHTATVILLFLGLRRMTGALWRSALVAAWFAIHPLRVESVAWVAERKDVLSGLFFMLTLLAYARYATGGGGRAGDGAEDGRWKMEDRGQGAEGGRRRAEGGGQRAEGRGQKTEVGGRRSRLPPSIFYLLSLCFFALGLMCKPMLVTLPVVLLLLDYWPLNRFSRTADHGPKRRDYGLPTSDHRLQTGMGSGVQSAAAGVDLPCPPDQPTAQEPSDRSAGHRPGQSVKTYGQRAEAVLGAPVHGIAYPSVLFWRLLLEKLPFLGLALISCAVTLFAQQGALASLDRIPLPLRFGNAAISYIAYLGQMFWPVRLAVLYPFNAGTVTLASTLWSLVLLAGISAWVLLRRRRQPYLLTGWLWYLLMLLPVIGILQVGSQARADRYTYLPQIGLYVILAWAAADLSAGWRHRRALLSVGAAAALAALMLTARAQAAHWQNTETLWTHTLACTTGNVVAHNNLGEALLKKDRLDEAAVQFQAALQIQPNSAQAHNNLGIILAQRNQADAAIAHFEKALQLQPRNPEAQGNLASVLFYQKGLADEAMAHCQQALESRPDLAQAHTILGHILLQKGRDAEAMAHYEQVLKAEPNSPIVLNNLGWILATSPDANLRNGKQAVRYAERADELTKYSVPPFMRDLAAAYAEAGRYDEAVAAAQRACALATAGKQLEVLEETKKELDLYLAHQPYHRSRSPAVPQ